MKPENFSTIIETNSSNAMLHIINYFIPKTIINSPAAEGVFIGIGGGETRIDEPMLIMSIFGNTITKTSGKLPELYRERSITGIFTVGEVEYMYWEGIKRQLFPILI